jgi:hypothetical protein
MALPSEPRLGRAFALEAVDVGWKAYSTTRHYAGTDADLPPPVGGTVVEKLAYREIDPDTGDITNRTVYRTLATWRPSDPWAWLDADEIDIAQLAGVDRNACYLGMRWLIRQVNARRRGPPTSDETDSLRYAWALLRAAL